MIHTHKRSAALISFPFMSIVGLSFVTSLMKMSFIVGSFCSFFSINNSIVPLTGAFGGILGSCVLSAIHLVSKIIMGNVGISSVIFALHLPSLGASLYWASRSFLIRVLVPALCMIAFCAHPVGGLAWAYSLFWLIPISLYFISPKAIFFESLGSTFIAHAIGSVLWLYSAPISAATWLGLIPLVVLERMMFATIMTGAYYIVMAAEKKLLPNFKSVFARLCTHTVDQTLSS